MLSELRRVVRDRLAAGDRALTLEVTLPWGAARIALVVSQRPDGVRIIAPVGRRDRFSAEAALAHNGTLAVGALVLGSDGFHLQAQLPRRASFEALVAATTLVAHEAARLANPRRAEPQATSALFVAYAE